VVTLGEKGELPVIEQLPLAPLHDVKKLSGTLNEILNQEDAPAEDYVSITLTDEESLYRPKDQLEERYHRILEVRLDNTRVRHKLEQTMTSEEHLTPFEAFREFYQEMNGQPMNEDEERILAGVIETAEEMV
jgi:exonuclease SbcD